MVELVQTLITTIFTIIQLATVAYLIALVWKLIWGSKRAPSVVGGAAAGIGSAWGRSLAEKLGGAEAVHEWDSHMSGVKNFQECKTVILKTLLDLNKNIQHVLEFHTRVERKDVIWNYIRNDKGGTPPLPVQTTQKQFVTMMNNNVYTPGITTGAVDLVKKSELKTLFNTLEDENTKLLDFEKTNPEARELRRKLDDVIKDKDKIIDNTAGFATTVISNFQTEAGNIYTSAHDGDNIGELLEKWYTTTFGPMVKEVLSAKKKVEKAL